MADIFIINGKVQAVDELGRWCQARIVEVDGEEIHVSFPGFPGADVHVNREHIRKPVLPYEQQFRECPERTTRKRSAVSRGHLQFLSSCQRGDVIQTSLGHETVDIVDPYHRRICLAGGATVDLQDVIIERGDNDVRARKRKRKLRHRHSNIATPVEKLQPACTQVKKSNMGTSTTDLPTVQPCQRTSVFQLGSTKCGSVYKIADLGIDVLVADIDIDQERCTTSPLVNGKVDDEITIEVKAARLKQGVKTAGSMEREGKRILQEKLKETVENCKDEDYRKRYRINQMRYDIQRNIKFTLDSRSNQKVVDLGLANIEFDFALFNLDMHEKTTTYSYRKNNIDKLDSLLGNEWDVCRHATFVKFVTSLRIRVSSQMHLTLQVKTAEFPAEIPSHDYRSILRDHMFHL